jgi:hypothetical protein
MMRRLPFLFVPLLIFSCQVKDAKDLKQDEPPIHPNVSSNTNVSMPKDVISACETVVNILKTTYGIDPEISYGTGYDDLMEVERSGCRISITAPISKLNKSRLPHDEIRDQFDLRGWAEDVSYSADGPGTTEFAYKKGNVLCMFSGGAATYIEKGQILTEANYNLAIACVTD